MRTPDEYLEIFGKILHTETVESITAKFKTYCKEGSIPEDNRGSKRLPFFFIEQEGTEKVSLAIREEYGSGVMIVLRPDNYIIVSDSNDMLRFIEVDHWKFKTDMIKSYRWVQLESVLKEYSGFFEQLYEGISEVGL